MYAKVARFDYPSEWPSLFNDLMANLSSGSALTVRRCGVKLRAPCAATACVAHGSLLPLDATRGRCTRCLPGASSFSRGWCSVRCRRSWGACRGPQADGDRPRGVGRCERTLSTLLAGPVHCAVLQGVPHPASHPEGALVQAPGGRPNQLCPGAARKGGIRGPAQTPPTAGPHRHVHAAERRLGVLGGRRFPA